MNRAKKTKRGGRWVYLLPLVLFALLVVLLKGGLNKDPSLLPSAFLAKPLPAFSAPLLEGEGEFTTSELGGRVWLLNIWASWCRPCQLEHPQVTWLAAQDLPVIGLNYKDDKQDALAWLEQFSNPFAYTVQDPTGRIGIELGVYGVPETFLISADGTLLYKHVGPLAESDAQVLLAMAREAQASANEDTLQ